MNQLSAVDLLSLLENSPNAILTTGTDGRITSWNKGAERIYRYTVSEAMGMPIQNLWPAELAAEQRALHELVVNGGTVEPFECRRSRKDGSLVDLVVTLSPLRDPQNEVVGVAKIAFDISHRKSKEAEERQVNDRFQLLADNIDQLVWIASVDGTDWWFNRRWMEFTGMRADEIIPRSAEIHHPDHLQRVTETLGEAGKKGVPWEAEYPMRRHDGEWRWFLGRAIPVRDAGGQVVRWFGTSTDITEQREIQEGLREGERKLLELLKENQELMAALDEHAIVAITDAKGKITYVNDKFCEISQYERHELLGKDHRLINSGHHTKHFFKGLWDTIKSGNVWHGAIRNRAKDGSFYWVDTTIVPFLNEEGEPKQFVSIRTDITEHRYIQELLETEGRNKDQFLATLAHELRNPLSPLMNGLQLLEVAKEDAELMQRTHQMMGRQLSHLVRLVNDLMDLSRIRRGSISLQKEVVPLNKVVEMAVEANIAQIEAKQQRLKLSLPDEPLHVFGDVTRLTQAFGNLLSNATRYSDNNGYIHLSIERKGDEAVVRILDDGVGMEPQQIPHIFELFSQLEQGNGAVKGGLGIGLNIVKQLVEMHEGTIDARSEGPSKGSVFYVRLPLVLKGPNNMSAEGIMDEGRAAAGSHRVLVVDDLEDVALSMAMLLSSMGHEVRVCHNGEQALKEAETFHPEYILMDLGMPVMNGYDACREIRNQPWGKDIRIIAISGWGQAKDLQRSKEAGFDEHYVKPIAHQQLSRIFTDVRSK